METQSPEIDKLAAAIVAAQMNLSPAKKDATNPFFHSKYADLPSVWEALQPFRNEGIAITQSPMESPDGFIVLETQLTHGSGQWMRSRLKMRVSKDDPQGAGSALTYARRYGLGCMTGLVTEEDDDGNLASHAPKSAPKTFDQKFPTQQAAPAPPPPSQAAKVQPPAQATKPSPVPTPSPDEGIPAQPSAFVWSVGAKHNGKRIEDIPLDYLEWFAANGKKADHVEACKSELARVAAQNQQKLSALCQAYLENITVSETVAECQRAIDAALTDENINPFEGQHLKETGERKLAQLRQA